MTDLIQSDARPQSREQQAFGSITIDTHPVKSQVRPNALRSLLRFSSFVSYTVFLIVVLACLLEFVSWAIWSVHPITRQAELENQGASPVYAGADWSQEFWREEAGRRKKPTVYVPFRIWGVTNWHSKYINNDQGIGGVWRRTVNPVKCDAVHRMTLWTFGGSTMYGTAVPDWATIPSYLSRDLNTASAGCVVVSNFGVEGYVTDQELILLAEELKAGGHPDIVVFYDGVNDSSLAWALSGQPNAHFLFRAIKTRVEGSLSGRLDFLQKSYAVRLTTECLARLRGARAFTADIAKAQPNVGTTLDNYEANLRLIHALAEEYKFKPYCFWQPVLIYGHKPMVPFEQEMATRDASGTSAESAWFLTMANVYREAENRSARSGTFVFLGALFDSTQEPIYVDEAHLGPRGNELAAQAIANYIQGRPYK
jgi:lysophospholipase L1-like esterase